MVHQYKQLTLDERYQIEVWNSLSISTREIGQKLKRFNGSFDNDHMYDTWMVFIMTD